MCEGALLLSKTCFPILTGHADARAPECLPSAKLRAPRRLGDRVGARGTQLQLGLKSQSYLFLRGHEPEGQILPPPTHTFSFWSSWWLYTFSQRQ